MSLNQELLEACHYGSVEKVKNAIEKGADVNYTGEYGMTCLMHAVWMGHLKIVKLLIKQGVNINATNKGWTALNFAKKYKHKEIEKILKKHGAS